MNNNNGRLSGCRRSGCRHTGRRSGRKMIAVLLCLILCLQTAGCARIKSIFEEKFGRGSSEKTGEEAGSEGSEGGTAQKDGQDAGNAAESAAPETGEETGSSRKEGAVLNIYCWDDSLRSILTQFYSPYKDTEGEDGTIGGVRVHWVEIDPDEYQEELDKHLLRNSYEETDDKIDIYLVDGDSLSKYVNTDFSVNLKGKLGLSDKTLSDQFPYTVQAATDENGILKGVTWIASPGVFVYKRSIAQQVFGTDDPETVQAAVADWDQFAAAAAIAHSKGYAMVSGIEDSYYAFRGGVDRPWVLNGNIILDENVLRWADQTRTLYAGGFTNDTDYKGSGWMRDLGVTGNVLGFFLSAYEIRQLMSEDGAGGSGAGIGLPIVNSDATDGGSALQSGNNQAGKTARETAAAASLAYGDYAMCPGPQAYFRGGIWMMAAPETDNPELARTLMEFVTGDAALLESLAEEGQLFTNSVTAMEKMARQHVESVMFDGQNQFTVFLDASDGIKAGTTSVYDNKLGYLFREAMSWYIYGEQEREEAIQEFYETARKEYPILAGGQSSSQ